MNLICKLQEFKKYKVINIRKYYYAIYIAKRIYIEDMNYKYFYEWLSFLSDYTIKISIPHCISEILKSKYLINIFNLLICYLKIVMYNNNEYSEMLNIIYSLIYHFYYIDNELYNYNINYDFVKMKYQYSIY